MRALLVFYLFFSYEHAICYASSLNKISVKSFTVTRYNFYEIYTAIGQSLKAESRDYYANKNGIVDFITQKQGSKVQKGDVIVAIESDQAKSNLEYARINLQNSTQEFQRNKSLYEKKVLSKKDLDNTRVAFEKAEADYYNALKIYNDSVITAPFPGTIGVVNAVLGNNVKLGDYLFSLVTNNPAIIFVELPESLYGKIFEDTTVTLIDSNSNKSKGKIAFVSPYLSDKGTITVKIESLEQSNFIHGSFVSAEFVINKHKATGILQTAVLKNDQGNFIYKIEEGGVIKQLYLNLGIRTDDRIEVLGTNLKENDLIVSEGLTKVRDGIEVEVIE